MQNCLEHVGTLPPEGTSYHFVTRGRWSLFHLIPTTLTFAAPAHLAYLGIGTLGFSHQNLTDLLSLFDSGRIKEIAFLFSVYFRSGQREQCERLVSELTRRKQKVVSMLTHCKLLLMATTDNRFFVAESSANLRSCGSIEQTTFTQDRELLTFHKQWLSEIMEAKK